MLSYIKIIIVFFTIMIISSCANEKISTNNDSSKSNIYSFENDSLYQIIYPSNSDFITYREKINEGFIFINNYLNNLSFDNNEVLSFSYFFKIDTINNVLRYYAIHGNDSLLVVSKIFNNPLDCNLKGTGDVFFNSSKIFSFEEKFSDTTLYANINFLETNSHISLKITYNSKDSLTNNRPFKYILNGYINSKNINISDTLNDVYSEEKINNIIQYSNDLYNTPIKNYTLGLIYLNNIWIGWNNSSNTLFKVNDCVEPCYGNDDAWLSYPCSVICGLLTPYGIGGIVYGAIDTYISTYATE